MSARPAGARDQRPRRVAALITVLAVVLVAVVVLVASVAHWGPFASDTGGERVLNGSAQTDLAGWQAASQAGPVTMTRATGVAGPAGSTTTTVDVRRSGGNGTWAYLVAAIDRPASVFTVGRTYRLQAYIRNVLARDQIVGILAADSHYTHRPTDRSQYHEYTDGSWHLLSLTFTCTAPAAPDTGLYIALPSSGAFDIQVTAASVRQVAATSAIGADTGSASSPPAATPSAVDQTPPSASPSGSRSASPSGRPSGSSTPSSSSTPATPTASRVLTFDGPAGAAPDAAVWNHQLGGAGWGNNEVQTYTAGTANAAVDGKGNLLINARREDATGTDGIARHYTSARLTTAGKVPVQPGSYVEATVKVPIGAGVWPAFWMMGADITTVGWPACGELDILESLGASKNGTTATLHTAHRSDAQAEASYGGGGHDAPAAASSRSTTHVYGVYFDKSVVRFYVDHRERVVLHASKAHAMGWTWPFGKPMYIILNVAVGGPAGDPTGHTFPRTMTVGPISIWDSGVPF